MKFVRSAKIFLTAGVAATASGAGIFLAGGADDGFVFDQIEYRRCYDGDTCQFDLAGVHPLFGEKIPVRVLGIDAPELQKTCEKEKILAKASRDFLRNKLENAQTIELKNASRGKYFRILAEVWVDEENVAGEMIAKNLAAPYLGDGPKMDWCGDEK